MADTPAARRPTARAWALLVSVLLHVAGIVLGWGFAARRTAPPEVEFRVEVAGAASEAVEAPEREPLEEVDPEPPLPDLVVQPAAPADAPVPEDLPDLEAPPEAPPPEWIVRGPSVTARTRPPPAPAPEAPRPPPVTVAPTPPVARAPSVASAGAAHVERASPLGTNRRPVYPPDSRRLGEQGTVVLRLELGADGSVTAVLLERSSGYPRLDEAAIAAAWGWRFAPALSDGVPVASSARQRVEFRLDAP